jgi:Ca2+-binding EF-hand superfamily protein
MGFIARPGQGGIMRSVKLSRFAGFAFAIAALCGFTLPSVAFAGNPDARFEALDANGDGKISPDEHSAAAARMFEKMDENGDGKVTASEMEAAKQKMLADRGMKGPKSPMSAADKIKTIDTNGDGVLSADEHAAGAKAMFDRMDTNDDGTLSKAEMKAGHEKFLQKQSK